SRTRDIALAAHEDISQRGLAGAVGSKEGVDLLRFDRQIEPVENRMAIHFEGEIANAEQGIRHCHIPIRFDHTASDVPVVTQRMLGHRRSMADSKRSVLRQGGTVTWGVRRHPVGSGKYRRALRLELSRASYSCSDGISIASNYEIMTRRGVLKITLIVAGALILTQCRPPTPVAAAVEFAPGVGADADQPAINELVAAFNEAEAAVKSADLERLMKF